MIKLKKFNFGSLTPIVACTQGFWHGNYSIGAGKLINTRLPTRATEDTVRYSQCLSKVLL